MTFEVTLAVLDLAGVFVFAITGALAAARKGMDFVGMFALALVTSTGGGTLRSMLVGDFPVPFLRTPWLLVAAMVATVVTYFAAQWIEAHMSRPIRFFDAIGLGVFTATGVATALNLGQPWWAALFLGCITAVFGGVLRDVLRQEVPLIFRPDELYATAAVVGAIGFLVIREMDFSRPAVMIAGAVVTIAVRLVAMHLQWKTRAAARREDAAQ
ncbi:MAG: trimeric intracellular cation channel family protein [Opitutaceae bacterium]